MRTIAISIDEPTLAALDRLAAKGAAGRRSALVREAVAQFLERRERQEQEERERAVFARHRSRLAREAKALVAAQARP